MIKRDELVAYLQKEFYQHADNDYCPNGLQIAGTENIEKIICGVSANQELIDAAIARQADAILVHHGFFWKGESPCLRGVKGKRIASLIKNDINCFAYHLPFDCHPELGNNILLGECLGLNDISSFTLGAYADLGYMGSCQQAVSVAEMQNLLEQKLGQQPLVIAAGEQQIRRVAWCTGAAQDALEEAAAMGVDAYITGEIAERTPALAKELGIHYFAAGHHATERFAVRAVAEHLQQHFSVQAEFIDIANPV